MLLQFNKGYPKRGRKFNGYGVVKFAKYESGGNVQGKLKQGFKLGKCFLLSDNNVTEIRGKYENDQIKVNLKNPQVKH